jgi:hypothetical protein
MSILRLTRGLRILGWALIIGAIPLVEASNATQTAPVVAFLFSLWFPGAVLLALAKIIDLMQDISAKLDTPAAQPRPIAPAYPPPDTTL